MAKDLYVKGVTGVMYVTDRAVIIERKGALALILHGLAGKKEIPFASIQALQFKEATTFVEGFIQLSVLGAVEAGRGVLDAVQDENTLAFDKKHSADAHRVYEYLQEMIYNRGPQETPSQLSIADEILKFKNLADQGIITQEEFEAKKQKLLNR